MPLATAPESNAPPLWQTFRLDAPDLQPSNGLRFSYSPYAGRDPAVTAFAEDLLSRLPQSRAVLTEANGMLDSKAIGEQDRKEIGKLIDGLGGFKLELNVADVMYLGKFTIVSVPGRLGTNWVNVYLVRVPGHSWTLAEAREVPRPFINYGQHRCAES